MLLLTEAADWLPASPLPSSPAPGSMFFVFLGTSLQQLCVNFNACQHIYQDENYLYTHYAGDTGKLISAIPIEFQDFTIKWSFNHFI
jgi:hypothetical protein